MKDSSNLLRRGPLRIQAVAEATGVPAPTLRAWERRYGVPAPARTVSAYRLYEVEDVAEIERMRDLGAQGVSASDAAVVVVRERAERLAAGLAAAGRGGHGGEGIEAPAVERLVRAVARMDGDAIDRELSAGGADDAAAFDRLIAPTLVRVGEMWAARDISVAHEHFASERIATHLRARLRASPTSEPRGRVLLACFDEEQHALALLAVALRFISWGFRPIILGARTPPSALADAIDTVEPDLVGLSLTIPIEARRARALVAAYASSMRGVPWIVGGGGARAIRATIEAHGGIVVDGSLGTLHTDLRGVLSKKKRHARSAT